MNHFNYINIFILISFALLNMNSSFAFEKIGDSSEITQMNLIDHFPKPKNGNTYVVAHRGAHIGIPENTLAAYQKAIDLGCDFVEIDIRKTKDGKFVSVHNSTVDAYVEGVSGKVNDFSLAELKQMNIGKRIGPDWDNERIPTFEEILQLCRGQIGIYLDLKEPFVMELIEIIKRYEMERDIVWYIPISYPQAIEELRRNCYKCLPMPDPDINDIEETIKKFNPMVIAPVMNQFSKSYLDIAHNYGVKVFVDEGEGNEEEWEMILNWGTDGIQTDDPEKLINYIKNRER